MIRAHRKLCFAQGRPYSVDQLVSSSPPSAGKPSGTPSSCDPVAAAAPAAAPSLLDSGPRREPALAETFERGVHSLPAKLLTRHYAPRLVQRNLGRMGRSDRGVLRLFDLNSERITALDRSKGEIVTLAEAFALVLGKT